MTTDKILLISDGIGCSLSGHVTAAPEIVPAGSKVELVARTQAAQATPFTEGQSIGRAISISPTPATAGSCEYALTGKLRCLCRWKSFVNPAGVPMGWSSTQRQVARVRRQWQRRRTPGHAYRKQRGSDRSG
jgi:hypothetical protein